MYHITLLINVFFLVVPSLALNASIYHVNQSNFSNEKIAGTYIDVIDDLQAAALFEKGMAFAEQRRLDSAVFYFKQVLPYYRQQERWLPYFEAQYYVSLSYTLLERNPTKTNDSLVMLLSLTERIGENAKDGAAEMYFALAWLNDNVIRDRVKAKECYLKSLEIRKKLYGNFHIKTAKSYANASQICMSNRDLAEAEQLLITALRVYPVVYGADHPENFRIYGAAFNVYQALGQFEKSLRYAHALYKFVNEKQMSLNEQLSACRYLTQVYFDLAQYEKSLEYALEEKMLLEKSDNVSTIRMAEVLNNIGRIYEFINPAEALHYTLASLKQKESLLGVTDALSLSSYLNYGNLLSKSGEQQSAEAYLKKGLAGYQMLPPSMTYEVIRAHGLLAQHYGRYGNPELVEENFNRARHLFDNASAEVKSNWVAFNYYCLASAAHLSNLTQNPQELLSELQHVKNVIQQYRSRAHLPADEKAWMNTSSSFHAFAMDALFAALEVQDNNHVKDKLFEAMEGSRALVLLPMFRLAAAKDALDVPGELLNKLAAVRTAINEKEIAQSNEAEILKLQHSLDSLHLILKSNYPSYYAIRYGAAITSIKNVQEQLNTSQALIQYFKSENHWYAGIINKDKYRFKRLSSNISIDSLAVAYRSAIINRSDNAKQMARRLHDIIWAPLELGNDITVITVVPDGALHHISFGSIQSEEGTYLAQQFAFSYEGSASLFVEKRRQQAATFSGEFVAFAPSFPENQFANMLAQAEITRAGLEPLKGAEQEAKRLSSLLGGKALLGKEATSQKFLEWATKAKVIHLATHAIIDDANPAGSRFVFAPLDSLEEGLLYAFELLNMDMQASLVTLSACNTGFGTLQRGEGVMSLARAFEYAGCPNILMSLWPVSDQVTAEFMEIFYTHLKEGNQKDDALRQAQFYFINAGGPKSDPYYWAGFVISGNPEAIEFEHQYTNLLYTLPLAVLLLAGIYIYRRRFFQ